MLKQSRGDLGRCRIELVLEGQGKRKAGRGIFYAGRKIKRKRLLRGAGRREQCRGLWMAIGSYRQKRKNRKGGFGYKGVRRIRPMGGGGEEEPISPISALRKERGKRGREGSRRRLKAIEKRLDDGGRNVLKRITITRGRENS